MASIPNFKYHEWLCKSYFSFLSATSAPLDLIQAANELGYESLCVNDFDGVYGLARSYLEAKDISSQTKLNYGAEIHLFEDHEKPILDQVTISLIAMSLNGYRNLNSILSFAHRDSKDRAYLTMKQLMGMNVEDLFVIIPTRGGFDYFFKEQKQLEVLKELFAGRIHCAVTKTFSKLYDRKIQNVFELSKKFELKPIISQDIFTAHRSEKTFHDVLIAIKNNLPIKQAGEYFFPNCERSFHTKAFIYNTYKGFSEFSQMLKTSEMLDEMTNFSLSEISYEYPKEMIPDGHTAQTYLEELAWKGAKERFGETLSAKVVELISKELDLISHLKYADYFITVWDIVSWARSQGILCQGRGSAANSAVCFSLGITSCNPTHFDLLFERFMSKERGSPPDIDVDFEHERREEVIQYIYRRYGRPRASMVANIITFRKKGSLRAVGKAFGIPEDILTTTANTLSTVKFRGESMREIVNYVRSSTQSAKIEDSLWDLWGYFSAKLQGIPRHMGLHSGGFVISEEPIANLVAQEPATMEGRSIIQWAKDDIEELGFFKIDCLALGMLTALRKSFNLVKEKYGVDLDLYQIPSDDFATYQMIQKADTIGVFQIESRAQMSMLPRLKPKCFYDLVVEIAIIRPGPIQGKVIHPYLRRRDGLEPITFPHDSVKNILAKTMGIVIFQEQMMRLAIELGDFNGGEANQLRKHIGSWNSMSFNRNLRPYVLRLIKGMEKKGVSKEYIESLVEQMKGFAHYGFPESHAISFAFIAYASSYLKCHYPAAFYTSVMNSQPMGFYSPHSIIQKAKQEGIEILPICVNHSTWDHSLEEVKSAPNRPKRFGIRIGFRIVKGLSYQAVEKMVNTRETLKDKVWKSFDEFVQTNKIARDDYTAIAATNAFYCFDLSRSQALWKAEAIPVKELIDVEEDLIEWEEKSDLEEAQLDFNATGTSIRIHPVEILKTGNWNYILDLKNITQAKSLEDLPPMPGVYVFGMITVKQAPPSAKGMVFYTIEDETGLINLVFTPQVYSANFQIIEKSTFMCVMGDLQKAGKFHSIMVKTVIEQRNISLFKNEHVGEQQDFFGIKARNF